ncbi:MAG: L-serine ammonia-lyase [Pseudomonadota bacterium]
MAISVFDIFKIGIGPSSSHTVGPMRAATMFALKLRATGILTKTQSIKVELYGSLGATGKGHGTHHAIVLGLLGETPEHVDLDAVAQKLADLQQIGTIDVLNEHRLPFRIAEHLIFHTQESLPHHPNGMRFSAFDATGHALAVNIYYSVGGGFVVDEGADHIVGDTTTLPYPFKSSRELLVMCTQRQLAISGVMLANELSWRTQTTIKEELLRIWRVMQTCVTNGCNTEGVLPGGLNVRRRAAALYQTLSSQPEQNLRDPLTTLDWVNLYALAVNEENAAGRRVVTAPTNGAAGIIPAVLHYFTRFIPGADDDGVVRFLLTAGAIAILYKENASISGAEVGCQGEVGVACSMAAGALTEVLGGTPEQVENAAEIGMEHNLGLTCDPIGGLVQVPCIERNAMGAVKAINAARMALRGDGMHFVSLDQVIKTMRDTGADMQVKYKETARGGLAVNVIAC